MKGIFVKLFFITSIAVITILNCVGFSGHFKNEGVAVSPANLISDGLHFTIASVKTTPTFLFEALKNNKKLMRNRSGP